MNNNKLIDPTIFGPGMWLTIHRLSLSAVTDSLKESFIIYMNVLCDTFPCQKCQPHFRSFIDTHSLRNYWNIDHGFFRWSWELHNDVNNRTGKYIYPFEEALSLFENKNVCTNCGQTEHNPVNHASISNTTTNTTHMITTNTAHVITPEITILGNTLSKYNIPSILTQYKTGTIQPKPFRLVVPKTTL